MASKTFVSLFDGTKKHKSFTKYNLYRGCTDFGALEQFNIFESGHSFLAIISYPKFLEKLAQKSSEYKSIIDNAIHIIEYEFKGLDGIEDITTDTMEINDGINSIQVINRVKEQSSSTVSMRYTEKSGSLLTKFTETYLQGIYDSRSSFKHYHGLIESGEMEDGYENEVFTLLYFVTDMTGLNIEKAYILLGGQFTKSDQSIYNSTKGEHDAKEITLEMNCFPAKGPAVTQLAHSMLQSMAISKKLPFIKNQAYMEYTVPSPNVSR